MVSLRVVLPPDWVAVVTAVLLAAGTVAGVRHYVSDADLRLALIGSTAIIPVLFGIFWQSSSLRVHVFRFYYRFWGPECRVRILGEIPVAEDKKDAEVLDEAVCAVGSVRGLLDKGPRLMNRTVVDDGKVRLTFDVHTVDPFDSDRDWEREEWGDEDVYDVYLEGEVEGEEVVEERRLFFNLVGFGGKPTKVDSWLGSEVGVLLERLNDRLKKPGAVPMYSLRADIGGKNPFLVFYLKDLPTRQADSFALKMVVGEGEEQVGVYVSMEYVDISARSPSRLLESAKKYLASPLLDSE